MIEVEISDTQGHLRVDPAELIAPGRARCCSREGRRRRVDLDRPGRQGGDPRAQPRAPGPRLADGRDQLPAVRSRRPGPGRRAGGLRPRWRWRRPRRSASSPRTSWRSTSSTDCLHLCGYDDHTERMPRRCDAARTRSWPTAGTTNPFRACDEPRRAARARGSGPSRRVRPILNHRSLAVVGLSLTGLLAAGLPVLALHLFAIALTKALRSYSPSLLEERCRPGPPGACRRGRPSRPADRAERRGPGGPDRPAPGGPGRDGRLTGWGPPAGSRWVILMVLAIGLLGYVLAGVIGKVFAETIIDRLWPASAAVRAAALPLTFGLRQVERLVEWSAGVSEAPQRPASVEVEIPIEAEDPGGSTSPNSPSRSASCSSTPSS